jgi:hypothetical protein
MAKMHPARQLIVRFLAVGLLAMHLLVVSMAMAPALHHWLHGDADEPDHQCAVTAMIDGQFDRPEAPRLDIVRPIFVAEFSDVMEPVQPLLLASPHASPGERAPPAA